MRLRYRLSAACALIALSSVAAGCVHAVDYQKDVPTGGRVVYSSGSIRITDIAGLCVTEWWYEVRGAWRLHESKPCSGAPQ